jgi:hypothetical protein
VRGHSQGMQTLALWVVAAGCQFDTSPLVRTDLCLTPAAAMLNAAQCPSTAKPRESMSTGDVFGNAAPTVAPARAAIAAIDAALPAAIAPSAPPSPGAVQPANDMDLDAGAGDARDATQSARDAAESGSDSAAQRPSAGTAFSACSSDSQCTGGLVCTVNPAWSGAGFPVGSPGYCTAACGANGTGSGCSQPTSGGVVASCQLNGLCMLGSCAQADCPSAMSCVQTPIPTTSSQVAYLSECRPPVSP